MGKEHSQHYSTQSIAVAVYFGLAMCLWSWIKTIFRQDQSQWFSTNPTYEASATCSLPLNEYHQVLMGSDLEYLEVYTGPSLRSAEASPVYMGFTQGVTERLRADDEPTWRVFLAVLMTENSDQTHPFTD